MGGGGGVDDDDSLRFPADKII